MFVRIIEIHGNFQKDQFIVRFYIDNEVCLFRAAVENCAIWHLL